MESHEVAESISRRVLQLIGDDHDSAEGMENLTSKLHENETIARQLLSSLPAERNQYFLLQHVSRIIKQRLHECVEDDEEDKKRWYFSGHGEKPRTYFAVHSELRDYYKEFLAEIHKKMKEAREIRDHTEAHT